MRRRTSVPVAAFTKGARHSSHSDSLPQLSSFWMIGVVGKTFADRGYGFAWAVPPPRARERDPISVWFPIAHTSTSARSGESCVSGTTPAIRRGMCVKFLATRHHGAGGQAQVWRTSGVLPCDAEEELGTALRNARDVRWDRITQEDIDREKRQMMWQRAAEPQQPHAGNLPDATDDAQQLDDTLRMRLQTMSDAAKRFPLRDEDLLRSVMRMRCAEAKYDNSAAGSSPRLSDLCYHSRHPRVEERRLEDLLRSLHDDSDCAV